ncbi:YhgE/Pip family protein [Homoserinibacter sp. GY 40078]|uniref:YhgE/Pip family protein n=1 Tax=Homoserinibacter sp. GY 40078 TaxID=2603275 RepID=UPI0011C6F6B8|nr:YhgE/Pip family protein [Homoserinibacter sp. GY 40078]TXK16318.1 YhgE/Pip domain-containing protein [Homoserinibacter sp. GY 40078]
MNLATPTTPAVPIARRRWVRILAVIAATVVPLSLAGLSMAALADTEAGIDRIPAAIVNEDEMVTQTADDGTETKVLAGRLLVTELTGDDSPGLDWQLYNADGAAAALADGEVYAVLTIPSDFSESVVSLSTDSPTQAELTLDTDDAHSYLAGTVAQSLGDGMVRAFGADLTKQYLTGIYAQIGEIGDAFSQAADGASQLADGAASAADGAEQYADGAAQAASGAATYADGVGSAASGASDFADGVGDYTSGVSSLAAGLNTLANETKDLGDLGTGVESYTKGVSTLAGLIQQNLDVLADPGASAGDRAIAEATLQNLGDQLELTAARGTKLGEGAAGLGELQSGIAQSAAGASKLASGGSSLATGADGLADGVGQLASGANSLADGIEGLATGASGLASGIEQLADGADSLASGLNEGSDQLASAEEVTTDESAAVASDPVGLDVATANAVTQIGQILGTYLVPLGLWIGAFAIMLVVPALSRRVLATTARSSRVLGSALLRAGLVAAVQAILLVALLHLVAGVDWALLPATLGFSLVAAAAFTAFHQLLTIVFGRVGLVVSLLLLSLQIATVGAIVPSQALAGPFSWLGSFMPLGWATTGLQQIVAGGEVGVAIGSVFALAVFGLASVLIARLAIRRTRRANALGLLLPATAA